MYFLSSVSTKAEKPIVLFIDDKEVSRDDDGSVSKGEFAGLVKLGKAWPSDDPEYTGISLSLKYDAIKFPNGVPTIRFGPCEKFSDKFFEAAAYLKLRAEDAPNGFFMSDTKALKAAIQDSHIHAPSTGRYSGLLGLKFCVDPSMPEGVMEIRNTAGEVLERIEGLDATP